MTTKYSEVSNRYELIDKYNIDREYLKYLENKMKLSNLKIEDIDISRTRENVDKILDQR